TLDFSKLLVSRKERIEVISGDSTRTVSESKEWYEAIFYAWGDQPLSEELRDIVTSMGLEYWYGQPGDFLFALRTGFFYEDPSYGNRKLVTYGIRIRFLIYGFDLRYNTISMFRYGENHPCSDTRRFTVLIGLGAVPESTRCLPQVI